MGAYALPMPVTALYLCLLYSILLNMTGKLKEARVHVDIAKEIDPDFCDIGYQEAVLQVRDWRQGQG